MYTRVRVVSSVILMCQPILINILPNTPLHHHVSFHPVNAVKNILYIMLFIKSLLNQYRLLYLAFFFFLSLSSSTKCRSIGVFRTTKHFEYFVLLVILFFFSFLISIFSTKWMESTRQRTTPPHDCFFDALLQLRGSKSGDTMSNKAIGIFEPSKNQFYWTIQK